MKKIGKKYKSAKEAIPAEKQSKSEAISLCKNNAPANFDESVDVAFSLGIDTKDAEQNIRTTVSLPNGNGKDVRIAVFAGGEALTEAESAGAEIVGGKELATKVASEQKLDADIVISTPEMMAEVGQLGKILGPQGLMPNPKTGTVTFEVESVIKNIKAGQVEFRADKLGNLHASVGKISFDADKLCENISVLVDTVKRMKPSSSKGIYLRNFSLSSTMGPGIKVDPQTV